MQVWVHKTDSSVVYSVIQLDDAYEIYDDDDRYIGTVGKEEWEENYERRTTTNS